MIPFKMLSEIPFLNGEHRDWALKYMVTLWAKPMAVLLVLKIVIYCMIELIVITGLSFFTFLSAHYLLLLAALGIVGHTDSTIIVMWLAMIIINVLIARSINNSYNKGITIKKYKEWVGGGRNG